MKNRYFQLLVFLLFCTPTYVGLSAATPAKVPDVQYNCIDVSAANGNINWLGVAKDPQIEFVYIRATEGKELDPMYKKNLTKVKKTDLKCGFVLHLNTNSSVKSQFDFFAANVKPEDCGVFPAILVDENKNWGKKFGENLSWMINYMTNYYGGAVIYTTEAFYNKHCNTDLNNSLPSMLVKPGKKEPVIQNAPVGTHALLWVFDKKAVVKGIQTGVNTARFMENRDISWLSTGGSGTQPAP